MTTNITSELPPPHYTLRVIPRRAAAPFALRLISFSLEERLHAPYELAISATLLEGSEPNALLDAHVELGIHRGEALRVVYGMVLSSTIVDTGGGEPIVELQAGPALARLGSHPHFRVFQSSSVVDVVHSVLEQQLLAYGSTLDLSRLRRTYEPLDCCVQYRETDLAFVLRILAEAGITLLLHHTTGSEVVVLVDDLETLPLVDDSPLGAAQRARIPWLPVVTQELRDRSVESIRLVQLASHGGNVELCALSNATMLRAGSVLELANPPTDDDDETWVVTSVLHSGQVLADDTSEYVNELECLAWRLPFAPARPIRPHVLETQDAIVFGPVGGPASFDELGRVLVRMRWSEPDHVVGDANCWIPIAQRSFAAVLRAGAVVLVAFIQGNPDQPVCVGIISTPTPVATPDVIQIASADGITLTCGKSTVEIKPDRIVFTSPQVSTQDPISPDSSAEERNQWSC